METIKFVLTKHAKLPKRGSKRAAGLDIHSAENHILGPLERVTLRTGVYLAEIPNETYLRVAPRSKLANFHGIDVLAGVVDGDYRSEIRVILYNSDTENHFSISKGDAIAQLVLEKYIHLNPIEVSHSKDTERGSRGINTKTKFI